MCGIWAFLLKSVSNPLFPEFMKISHRGPDKSTFTQIENLYFGFHRLALVDLSVLGDQPFIKNIKTSNEEYDLYTLCNGEIYNYKELINTHKLTVESHSDCAVIPEMFIKYGIEKTVKLMNGEFSFTIIKINKKDKTIEFFIGRDPFGVRPLFYSNDLIGFGLSSELKGLATISNKVEIFPPGHYAHWKNNNLEIKNYISLDIFKGNDVTFIKDNKHARLIVKHMLTKSVEDRLETNREIGALLSGGIDSSLVAAIAARKLKKEGKKIKTFSIGTKDSTDLYYANLVAKHIDSEHIVIDFDPVKALKLIPKVIEAIESYDITTVRASTVQYYLISEVKKYIPCVLNGDGSDEVSGSYLYFHNAPNDKAFNDECIKLLEEIHRYDVLRVDRTIAAHGVEARVPFLDVDYVNSYLSIDPSLRRPRQIITADGKTYTNKPIEKALLREAFLDENLIPEEVLMRKKEAFSDGCSNTEKSWFRIIQDMIDKLYTDEEFQTESVKFEINQPKTKEAYYYRMIFTSLYGENNAHVIPHMWLPNWSGNIQEPSARVLDVYKND